MLTRSFVCAILLAAVSQFSFAQVAVDVSKTPEFLVKEELIKGGVDIQNIKFTGPAQSIGLFQNSSDKFPISRGILLSTGKAEDAAKGNYSSSNSFSFYSAGDQELTKISGGTTSDAAVLEFEFIPTAENLSFNFIFASEEYMEYANTLYNDIFAFIITDLETGKSTNIAYLPTEKFDPITVNNVNLSKNASFYNDNPHVDTMTFNQAALDEIYDKNGELKKKYAKELRKMGVKNYGNNTALLMNLGFKPYIPTPETSRKYTAVSKFFQYDGYTNVLTAKTTLVPFRRYKIKIAIADVHDSILDSSVFLESNSFKSADKSGVVLTEEQVAEKLKEIELAKQNEDNKNNPVVTKDTLPDRVPDNIIIDRPAPKDFSFAFYFETGSSTISAAEKAEFLKKMQGASKSESIIKVNIEAHTDSVGSQSSNKALAQRRAKAVVDLLKSEGYSITVTEEHHGEDKPKHDNGDQDGRAKNRRVDVAIEENRLKK